MPRPLSSFIGREGVLTEAAELLSRNRLVTLTGPGGSGKTRLSIELAARVGPGFPDGVHFVALAAIRDSALVPTAIAQGRWPPSCAPSPGTTSGPTATNDGC